MKNRAADIVAQILMTYTYNQNVYVVFTITNIYMCVMSSCG